MKTVLCKKNFIGGNSTGSLYFRTGLEYDCEDFVIDSDRNKRILIYDLSNRNSHYFPSYVFCNYFYTEQEMRKLKLKKLNGLHL